MEQCALLVLVDKLPFNDLRIDSEVISVMTKFGQLHGILYRIVCTAGHESANLHCVRVVAEYVLFACVL